MNHHKITSTDDSVIVTAISPASYRSPVVAIMALHFDATCKVTGLPIPNLVSYHTF